MDRRIFVLIAEDDSCDKFLIEKYLNENAPSIAFQIVNNGKELLDFFHQGQILPDVVLSDINMPRLNGLEALKLIREIDNEKIHNIPFIISSSSCSEQEQTRALELGANQYIEKPNCAKEYHKISDAIFELVKTKNILLT
jgi:CheY-like chemotaxis protein